MSRAEDHGWYGGIVEPWTEEQLADYYRLHDGSAPLITLMENAADIEEEAVRRFNERR
jgi:hypothetical protein